MSRNCQTDYVACGPATYLARQTPVKPALPVGVDSSDIKTIRISSDININRSEDTAVEQLTGTQIYAMRDGTKESRSQLYSN